MVIIFLKKLYKILDFNINIDYNINVNKTNKEKTKMRTIYTLKNNPDYAIYHLGLKGKEKIELIKPCEKSNEYCIKKNTMFIYVKENSILKRDDEETYTFEPKFIYEDSINKNISLTIQQVYEILGVEKSAINYLLILIVEDMFQNNIDKDLYLPSVKEINGVEIDFDLIEDYVCARRWIKINDTKYYHPFRRENAKLEFNKLETATGSDYIELRGALFSYEPSNIYYQARVRELLEDYTY